MQPPWPDKFGHWISSFGLQILWFRHGAHRKVTLRSKIMDSFTSPLVTNHKIDPFCKKTVLGIFPPPGHVYGPWRNHVFLWRNHNSMWLRHTSLWFRHMRSWFLGVFCSVWINLKYHISNNHNHSMMYLSPSIFPLTFRLNMAKTAAERQRERRARIKSNRNDHEAYKAIVNRLVSVGESVSGMNVPKPVGVSGKNELVSVTQPSLDGSSCVGTSTVGRMKRKRTKPNKRERTPFSFVFNFYCIFCNEQYVEPVFEDWIQCCVCKLWAHEKCSAYEGLGDFICDECMLSTQVYLKCTFMRCVVLFTLNSLCFHSMCLSKSCTHDSVMDILWFRHDSLPAVKIGWDYFRAEIGWNSLVHQLSFCDMYRAVARIRHTSRVFVIKIPSRNLCPLVCDSIMQLQIMITN